MWTSIANGHSQCPDGQVSSLFTAEQASVVGCNEHRASQLESLRCVLETQDRFLRVSEQRSIHDRSVLSLEQTDVRNVLGTHNINFREEFLENCGGVFFLLDFEVDGRVDRNNSHGVDALDKIMSSRTSRIKVDRLFVEFLEQQPQLLFG